MVFPLIPAAIAIGAALISLGCDSQKPKYKCYKPDKKTPFFFPKFTNQQAETMCRIESGLSRVELENEYYNCAQKLLDKGDYQPALSIFRSLGVNAPNKTMQEGRLQEFFTISDRISLSLPMECPPAVFDRNFNHLKSLR